MKNLVIVESPSKSKTIEKYLGATIMSSPARDISVIWRPPARAAWASMSKTIFPNYKISADKKEVVKELQKLAKKSDHVYLASDPDREGEAIAWHLASVLGLDMNEDNRIVFHEITKQAVLEAMKHPQKIDQDLVHSQETRRMLDRIIGFRLSKLLQNKIQSKSAGRVQSVALRLIVERENEIRNVQEEEYWTLDAKFKEDDKELYAPVAQDGWQEGEAEEQGTDRRDHRRLPGTVHRDRVRRRGPKKREPKMPFITSTLQQEASPSWASAPRRRCRSHRSCMKASTWAITAKV
ncbi:MAG: DNA topoisomerase [Merdibacter sp.]